jgi:hypothetical protein
MKHLFLLVISTLFFHATALAQQAEDRTKKGPTGIISVPYKLPHPAKNGYDSLTFTIRIDEAPNKERSFYYAMQFKFIDGNGGYIGIQPRGEEKGLAIFSLFGKGGTPVSEHCRGGADGGSGVSCSKAFAIDYGTDYYLDLVRDKDDKSVWRGFIKNVKTGEKLEIGAFKPKATSKGLAGSNGGFVEYFPAISDCSEIPHTKGFFGHPSAKTADGKMTSGQVGKLHSYGRCKNMRFTTNQTATGSHIELMPE